VAGGGVAHPGASGDDPSGTPPQPRELERSVAGHLRAEEALRQAEEKYRGIFENVMEGIYQTTPDGHYVSANPMLARIYGFDSAEELIAAIQDIRHQVYIREGAARRFRALDRA